MPIAEVLEGMAVADLNHEPMVCASSKFRGIPPWWPIVGNKPFATVSHMQMVGGFAMGRTC